jgi:hypothetical protein
MTQKILIIDDENATVQLLTMLLEGHHKRREWIVRQPVVVLARVVIHKAPSISGR